jgi:hypothetical protein
MKRLLLLVAAMACWMPLAIAQTMLTLTGPATVRPGQTIELELTTAGSGEPAGLQWTLTLPAGFTAQTAAGSAAQAGEKTLYCSEDDSLCLVVGLNSNTIPNGKLARYAVLFAPETAKGQYALPLSGLVAGTAMAILAPVTSGPVYEIRVLARSDLNGDGATNILDLNLMLDQVLGRAACGDDQNGDGKCDLIDLLAVIRGALDE